MSDLADRLTLISDQVALARQWIDRDRPDEADKTLASIEDQLVALADEVNR